MVSSRDIIRNISGEIVEEDTVTLQRYCSRHVWSHHDRSSFTTMFLFDHDDFCLVRDESSVSDDDVVVIPSQDKVTQQILSH